MRFVVFWLIGVFAEIANWGDVARSAKVKLD